MVFVLTGTQATALAAEQSDTITVTAVILPAKSIFVNQDMKITKIFSNSTADAPPKVFLDSSPSKELAMTNSIFNQYSQIKSAYNLNKIGEVYRIQYLASESNKLTAIPNQYLQASSRLDLSTLRLSISL